MVDKQEEPKSLGKQQPEAKQLHKEVAQCLAGAWTDSVHISFISGKWFNSMGMREDPDFSVFSSVLPGVEIFVSMAIGRGSRNNRAGIANTRVPCPSKPPPGRRRLGSTSEFVWVLQRVLYLQPNPGAG